jgi:hypothetical protein
MYNILITSTALLVGFSIIRYLEMLQGARAASSLRQKIDVTLWQLFQRIQQYAQLLGEYASRDTLVKILHMGTYLVLLLVRALERKLTTVSKLLRSVRKKKQPRSISPGLDKVERGVDPS